MQKCSKLEIFHRIQDIDGTNKEKRCEALVITFVIYVQSDFSERYSREKKMFF